MSRSSRPNMLQIAVPGQPEGEAVLGVAFQYEDVGQGGLDVGRLDLAAKGRGALFAAPVPVSEEGEA